MRNRHHRSRSSIDGLHLAVECMPVATREAMLRGVRSYERIIVGAYVDEQGGVCPMLAAHRCGGRTDFLSFAKSWDRFARPRKGKRLATARELAVLVNLLETSLASSSGLELDRAIAEHRALLAAGHRAGARLAAEADPRGELIVRRLRLPRRRRQQLERFTAEEMLARRRDSGGEQRALAIHQPRDLLASGS